MTWENYGSEWHLDHKIPLSVHNFTKPEHSDFKKAWSLKNLQPLWAEDNLKKNAKLNKPFQPSLLL
jgi:5-methylcytosine-specific restriction endonuclease McrA